MKKIKKSSIGNRIEHLRSEVLHIKQKEMADKLGVAFSTVSSWELNSNPPLSAILNICNTFGINRKWLEEGIPPIKQEITIDTKDLIEELKKRFNLSPLTTKILIKFLNLSNDDQKKLCEIVHRLVSFREEEKED